MRRTVSTNSLEVALADFARNASIESAVELVHAATCFGEPRAARGAAEFLQRALRRRPVELSSMLSWILHPDDQAPSDGHPRSGFADAPEAHASRVIRANRVHLLNDPRNAVRWLDLARAYTVLGSVQRAERAVLTALSLTPNHRVTIRTYARWLVHNGRVDQALAFVRSHPRTRADPWLMSLEIALATLLQETPELAIRGRKTAVELHHQPAFISELASAIATLDLEAGDHRRSRKLFRLSVEVPTDTAVAQMQWAARLDRTLVLEDVTLEEPQNVEARYWKAMWGEDWSQAMAEVQGWQGDEPFSKRPAINGSHLALAFANRPDIADQMARVGLRADPDDQMLRNNLVVALIHEGRFDEATNEFRTIRYPLASSYPEFVYCATSGLVAFAAGNPEVGRARYDRAFELAPTSTDKARVLLHLFEAWSIANPPAANSLVPEFRNIWEGSKSKVLELTGKKMIERHSQRLGEDRVAVDGRTGKPILDAYGKPFATQSIPGQAALRLTQTTSIGLIARADPTPTLVDGHDQTFPRKDGDDSVR
jgi:Tfp pilus assembly protein PilF